MKRASAIFLSAAMVWTQVGLAVEDPAPAPMMAPAQAPMSEEGFQDSQALQGRTDAAESILARFRQQFADNPLRLAVFWNSELPERVSDWSSRKRVTLGVEGSFAGTHQGKAEDLSGQTTFRAEAETRGPARSSSGQMAFALQSGLIQVFREGNAAIVDQAMSKRITDNKLEDGTFRRLSPDEARLQMRALEQHADYVLELNVDKNFADNPRYQIRVLSVKDASVLASLTSPGTPPASGRRKQWVATDRGFQQKEQPVTLQEIGRELALHTMEVMTTNRR